MLTELLRFIKIIVQITTGFRISLWDMNQLGWNVKCYFSIWIIKHFFFLKDISIVAWKWSSFIIYRQGIFPCLRVCHAKTLSSNIANISLLCIKTVGRSLGRLFVNPKTLVLAFVIISLFFRIAQIEFVICKLFLDV